MIFTFELLEIIRKELQNLSFDVDFDRTVKTTSELSYIDHYGLPLFSERSAISHYLGLYASGDFKLAAQYWLPDNPKGTYFIIHGYLDHVGLYGHLIRHLIKLGYAVVAFDLPGHGLSSGNRATIKNFDPYVDAFSDLLCSCEARFPKPWKAAGQSTGGAILIKYLLCPKAHHYENNFVEMIALAPLIHPVNWKKNLYVYHLLCLFLKKIKRKYNANTANEKFNEFVENHDPLQSNFIPIEWIGAMRFWIEEFLDCPSSDYPLRVIQGDHDKTVDWQYNLKVLRKKFCNIEIQLIHSAQHHMVNETPSLRSSIFKYLD